MIYPYRCLLCSFEFEVIKPVGQMDYPELCLKCGKDKTERYISRTHCYGISDWDSAAYNPGLGQITKNRKHRDQIAKERGLIEVGNEDCDKICDSQDRKLSANIEETTKSSYDALEYGLKHDYLDKR